MDEVPYLFKSLRFFGILPNSNGTFSTKFLKFYFCLYFVVDCGYLVFMVKKKLEIYEMIYMLGFISETIFLQLVMVWFLTQREQIRALLQQFHLIVQRSIFFRFSIFLTRKVFNKLNYIIRTKNVNTELFNLQSSD